MTRLPAVGATGGQWAEWSFPFTAGNLTAIGYSSAGAVAARHTVETTSAATAVIISVDVPSAATGTGEALVLDGQDSGLLRATVVDSKGRTVPCVPQSPSHSSADSRDLTMTRHLSRASQVRVSQRHFHGYLWTGPYHCDRQRRPYQSPAESCGLALRLPWSGPRDHSGHQRCGEQGTRRGARSRHGSRHEPARNRAEHVCRTDGADYRRGVLAGAAVKPRLVNGPRA
eukprot:COSAG04_NODE_2167_length_4641_cov_5.518274_4_plen_227_part_01